MADRTEYKREWARKNRERKNELNREWYKRDAEAKRSYFCERRREMLSTDEGRKRAAEQSRQCRLRDPDRAREVGRENQRRRNSTPEGKIEVAVRNATKRMVYAGGKKPNVSLRLLGCTIEEARLHIEARFLSGMTWSNHGEWELDHIRPIASFDLSDPEQVYACASITNLQPLWLFHNRSKGARV